ncbi:hypothetical protein [Burkholderia pseudomallei]|uniref:hypothetical protein n=1 Tax=Burkholderia pseudomallei TaxID=28450 RepID=UPI0012F9674E|nr:hypothetical protein [Burkholderia pseudomallei]
MLNNFFWGAAWIALGIAAICLVCSLFVGFFYSTYAQWYVDRNRVAPSRLRGFIQCVGSAIGMLFVGLMFAVANSKTMPSPESSLGAPSDALVSDLRGSLQNEPVRARADHAALKPTPAEDGPSLAAHTAGLLDQLDVFVFSRPESLKDSMTYYRGFDNPIAAELDRWQALGAAYSDTPALCRDALVRLQSVGIAIHGASIDQKYIDQDKTKYSTLKRRCKAAVAGDNVEAARRE